MFLKIMSVLVLGSLLLVGCGKGDKENLASKAEEYSEKLDREIFKDDYLLTVKGYELDSSARIYVLGECAKIVKLGETTPKHCQNASEAEFNVLFSDVSETPTSVAKPLDEEALKELKDDIVRAYTFKKM